MSSTKFCVTVWLDPKKDKVYEEKELEKIINIRADVKLRLASKPEQLWEPINKKGVMYVYFQLEQGDESKGLHIQMYLEYCKKTTCAQMKQNLKDTWMERAHYDTAYGSRESNWLYCGKAETKVMGPFEFGSYSKDRQGTRTDLKPLVNMAKEGAAPSKIARKHPEEYIKFHKGVEKLCDAYAERIAQNWTVKERKETLKVYVIWGAPGTGKTRRVYESHSAREIYSLRRPNGNSLWFDGYHNQKVLLIDEFKGWIPFQQLLKLLDIYPIQVDKKGSTCWNNWEIVYICSNKSPDEWYPNISKYEKKALHRRFTVVEEILPEEAKSDEESDSRDLWDDDSESSEFPRD